MFLDCQELWSNTNKKIVSNKILERGIKETFEEENLLKMNELEHINCPLCDSTNHQKLLTGKDYLFSQEKFTIVRCDSCGLLFTNPRVKEDQISFYYYPDYSPYKEVKQSRFFQKVKNRLGRLLGNTHWEILQILQSIRAKTVLEIGPGNGSLLYFLKHTFMF